MANAILICFGEDGQWRRVRNRLGTDITDTDPLTADEINSILGTIGVAASGVLSGTTSPEGVVSAAEKSLYVRVSASEIELYVKGAGSGTGNTGWVLLVGGGI